MPLPADDVLAIQKLLADYNHAVDAGDGATFAGLFTEDGSLDSGFGVTEGRAALAEFAAAVPVMVPGTRHLITNLSIDGDGDGATTKVYLQMWATAGGAPETKLVISGIYEDTLRRDGGQWRFATRKLVADA
jgi:uncharacterized protein (TIGR02246 family)